MILCKKINHFVHIFCSYTFEFSTTLAYHHSTRGIDRYEGGYGDRYRSWHRGWLMSPIHHKAPLVRQALRNGKKLPFFSKSRPTYIHTCMHTYIGLYIHAYIHALWPIGLYIYGTYIHTCTMAYRPIYIHPCIPTSQVARFARPFESRPADPVRREVYRQLAATSGTASTSGWVAPSTTLPVTPPPLERGTEESASRIVPSKPKGKWKRSL